MDASFSIWEFVIIFLLICLWVNHFFLNIHFGHLLSIRKLEGGILGFWDCPTIHTKLHLDSHKSSSVHHSERLPNPCGCESRDISLTLTPDASQMLNQHLHNRTAWQTLKQWFAQNWNIPSSSKKKKKEEKKSTINKAYWVHLTIFNGLCKEQTEIEIEEALQSDPYYTYANWHNVTPKNQWHLPSMMSEPGLAHQRIISESEPADVNNISELQQKERFF